MRNLSVWQAVAIASQVGVVFATAVAIGLFAGWYLDSVLNTGPFLTVVGALLGTASGVYSCIQIVRFLNRGGPSA